MNLWVFKHIQSRADNVILHCRGRIHSGGHGWNVNVGYSENGIAEITILDAKAAGYWPLENANDLVRKGLQKFLGFTGRAAIAKALFFSAM